MVWRAFQSVRSWKSYEIDLWLGFVCRVEGVVVRKVALGAFWIADREVARMQRHLKVNLTRNLTFEIILPMEDQ